MSDTHFEIAIKTAGGWKLTEASSNKADAIAKAEALLGRARVEAVRVTRERYDPAQGMFTCQTVFQESAPRTPREGGGRSLIDVAERRLADRVDEFETLSAAETVIRLQRARLIAEERLAGEYLFWPAARAALADGPKLIERTMARAACVLRQDQEPLAARVKTLTKLWDHLGARTHRLIEQHGLGSLPPRAFAALPADTDRLRLTIVAAASLYGQSGLAAKLSWLTQAAACQPRRPVMTVIDRFLAEWALLAGDSLVPEGPSIARAHGLARLGLGLPDAAAGPAVQQLAQAIKQHSLPAAARHIQRAALRRLTAPVSALDPAEMIALARIMADPALDGRRLDGVPASAAARARLDRLMDAPPARDRRPAELVDGLARLMEVLTDPDAQIRLAERLVPWLTAPATQAAVRRAGPDAGLYRALARMAEAGQAGDLPPPLARSLSAAADEMGVALLPAARLTAAAGTDPDSLFRQGMELVHLLAQQGFVEGRTAQTVRRTALKALRASKGLTRADFGTDALRDLHKNLARAGLG